MWKQFIKDYLSFSRRERRAVLVLLALILLVFVLPYWWPARKVAAPEAQLLSSLPSPAEHAAAAARVGGNKLVARDSLLPAYAAPEGLTDKARLFYFDPNTLDAAGWRQLGLRDRTVLTILHYRGKGGYFRWPEDIGKIYGLRPADYARLLPYVQIKAPVNAPGNERDGHAYLPYAHSISAYPGHTRPPSGSYSYSYKPLPPRSIDINTADTTAFIALPGIGSRLANRIIRFREKLGGFYCVAQVGETYALPDSVFQQIKNVLTCDSGAVRRININTADVNTLRQHPYMRWSVANAIVAYRAQHGDYKSVDELERIEIITTEDLQRLRPYLYVP